MKWVLAEPDAGIVATLADRSMIHPLMARLMVNRGIVDSDSARAFLSRDRASLSDPFLFRDMERVVNRIRTSIEKKALIVVYGDYDVDGVTAAALLYLVLRSFDANVQCYIPDRMSEGYGLNAASLAEISKQGADLVLSVDCGISARQEAAVAKRLALDLIITDHHEFGQPGGGALSALNPRELPEAYAILHPLLLKPDQAASAQEQVSVLTGVGVAFKLAQALLGVSPVDERLTAYLDLVTLGTIADVGRMAGENRVLVKHGLEVLTAEQGQRPGIAALKEVSGLLGKNVGVGAVGFTLAPRINASGRLERAEIAFRLLTTDSRTEALEIAATLDTVNKERQAVEGIIREEARAMCLQSDLSKTGAFVLASDAWHPGVIGIVASRIVDEFYRPTALISIQNGVGKGSARSIPGLDLYAALNECSGLLLGFGGHKYAAGFSIDPVKIPQFRERLGILVLESMGREGFVRTLSIDGSVSLSDLTVDLVRELDALGPFGQGNPEPRLGARYLEVISSRVVGNNHLKLRLRQGDGPALDAIAFKKGTEFAGHARVGTRLAAVFTPRVNAWNGSAAVELEIKDLKREKTGCAA